MTEEAHSSLISIASEDPVPELAAERRVAPMILWGAWPGEEPLEALLGQADE